MNSSLRKQQRDIQASYERNFKRYERLPQPKVIAVDANIDLDPAHRSFSGAGHFVLQNKTLQPDPADPLSRTPSSRSPMCSSTTSASTW